MTAQEIRQSFLDFMASKCYIDEPGKKGAPSTPVLKTLKVDKKGIAKVAIQPMGGLILTR